MTTFNFIDITPAGAFCNAFDAADRSDRRNRAQAKVKPTGQDHPVTDGNDRRNTVFTATRKIISTIFRPIGLISRRSA